MELTNAYLSVQKDGGETTNVALLGDRMTIGRAQNVEIVLDSQTVSRRHAEVYTDPYGRWWIRDLGSRNGTIINGGKIDEHVLQLGDSIRIEEYTLQFRRKSTYAGQRLPATAAGITIGEMTAGPMRSLRDFVSPKIDASHISLLTELGGKLLRADSEDARLRMLCELMVSEHFHATCALAMRINRADPTQMEMLCAPVYAGGNEEPPHISRTLLRAVVQNDSPMVASNSPAGGGGSDVVELSIVAAVRAMAAIACPMARDEESMEILYLTLPANFGTSEWLALAALACEQFENARAAWLARQQAEDQAVIEQELKRAHKIQMRLVPKDFKVSGLDIGFGFQPCKWVGGDYVDALPTRDERIFLTVMDVCGKGLQAALITTSLHTTIQLLIRQGLSLAQTVSTLNDHLIRTLPDESFVTMCAMVIDPRTGDLECVNFGHPPALLVDPQGNVRELQSGEHPPLGYLPLEPTVQKDNLPRGWLVCGYSDGLSEMINEQDAMLGIDGVKQYLAEIHRNPTGSATQLVRDATQQSAALIEKLAQFQGKALTADDMSFFITRRT